MGAETTITIKSGAKYVLYAGGVCLYVCYQYSYAMIHRESGLVW